MIRKRRKIVNGIEITLLERTVSQTPIQDQNSFFSDVEAKLRTYVNDKFQSIPTQQITTEIQAALQQVQSESFLSGSPFTIEDFLSIAINEPEDGSIVSYDDQEGSLSWVQSPSVKFAEIDNTLINYNTKFESDHIYSNRLHVPFAVAWGENNWGGNGKSGIFWIDPWDEPIDNYSIKMGMNNEDIGETGYSFGYVSQLAMKFSNGSEGGRGFVWTSVGAGGSIPVMALDTNDPLTNGGNLWVNRDIKSVSGSVIAENDLNGNRLVVNENQDLPYNAAIWVNTDSIMSGTNLITVSTLHPPSAAALDGYIMKYRYITGPVGVIGLVPDTGGVTSLTALTDVNITEPIANGEVLLYSTAESKWINSTAIGGGGASLPSVELDMGAFLEATQPSQIDCGSFI